MKHIRTFEAVINLSKEDMEILHKDGKVDKDGHTIEYSVNEGKNSAVWTSPKTGKSYDIQKNGNRWEMDIMKKGSSIYDKVTTIKRKTPQELKDWLDGYKIDSHWMSHLVKESVNEAESANLNDLEYQIPLSIEKVLGINPIAFKGIKKKYNDFRVVFSSYVDAKGLDKLLKDINHSLNTSLKIKEGPNKNRLGNVYTLSEMFK